MREFLFSSESVTEGHPDKVADQISDAVLDAVLKDDPFGRVACETFVTTGLVLVGGEISTTTYVDVPDLVRSLLQQVGYISCEYGFDYQTCAVLTSIHQQSSDIAMGVNHAGAGDQGMMFGFACRETPELMPMPISLAHRLAQRLAEMRHTRKLPYLRPDGKSQVTVRYADGKPVSVEAVVIAAQHDPDVEIGQLQEDIKREVVEAVIPPEMLSKDCKYFINATGRFVQGGPQADAGLTGRKTVVDTYGGYVPHGGGCFSGKDPTKVDRSASYAARWVAKNIVGAGLADSCLVQLAYAIGVAEPVSLLVNTSGSNTASKMSEKEIQALVRKHFDLTPAGIIDALNLLRPIYLQTATYGHFGRDGENFTWEQLNKVDELS
jgi:S-adenosylmethionine synthetase